MLRILVVDDSENKVSRIRCLVRDMFADDEAEVQHVSDGHSAGALLRATAFDLLILDILIPLRADSAPTPDGGVVLLEQLVRKKNTFNTPAHVVGLTEHDELLEKYQRTFRDELWLLIKYDESSDEWAQLLGRKLVHVAEAKNPRARDDYRLDLAVVTALEQVELESLLDLQANWRERLVDGDDTIYHTGRFERGGKSVSVAAAAAIEMGMPAATGLSMKMIENFAPRYLAIVGIAAGIEGNFGDVLIASHAWDYGSGKSKHSRGKGSVFLPAPSQIPLSTPLRAKLGLFVMRGDALRRIQEEWPGEAVETELSARIGPVASGAAVLESKPLIAEIRGHNRKLIGVEMETYGVFMAARVCREPRPLAMSIKSICDFGDSRKNDDHQRYAAFTSARFLYEFALDQLVREHRGEE